jgi:hypothetical protein
LLDILHIHMGFSIGDPAGNQSVPFKTYHLELQDAGMRVDFAAFTPELLNDESIAWAKYDRVVVMVPWSMTVEDLSTFLQSLRQQAKKAKILFLDYYAPTCSPHFAVLPLVDRFIKRQVLKNRNEYLRDYAGGYIFTDYLQRELGRDLNGWHFGQIPEQNQLHKVVPGWSLGVTPGYEAILKLTNFARWPRRFRPYRLNLKFVRASTMKGENWYDWHRKDAFERLADIPGPHSKPAPTGYREYMVNLALSRVTPSPLGWGEVCFRDYEAVATGCLLVKPDMSHLETSPDIYDEGTYVPCRWDLADLREKCEHYLDHPREADEIARNAREKYTRYFKEKQFVSDFEKLVAF